MYLTLALARAGPRESGALPAHAITYFPSIEVPEEKKLETSPIYVCKVISIHKCQGVSVGPGKQWERVVIILPDENQVNLMVGPEKN
eukprot:3616124-Ditylum_brightwellii.AAC.1